MRTPQPQTGSTRYGENDFRPVVRQQQPTGAPTQDFRVANRGVMSQGVQSQSGMTTVRATAPQRDAAAVAKTASISREQSRKAMSDWKSQQQAKFKRQEAAPIASTAQSQATRTVIIKNVVYRGYDPNWAYHRRTAFYGSWHPMYTYGFYPNYGLWNTFALMYMLDHMHDDDYARFYYNHRYDPDMQSWRDQAMRTAELQQKVRDLEARANDMERRGVAKDPSYIPPQMGDIALSDQALQDAAAVQPQSVEPAVQQQSEPVVSQMPQQSQQPAVQHHFPWGAFLFWTVVIGALLYAVYYFGFKRKYKRD